jgi:glycosyltransferase involved in cell wall biosynthesis
LTSTPAIAVELLVDNAPLISIIMPIYNGEKYVAAAIHSVLDQSHENWELNIVNDGSTDSSRAVLQPFLSDSRINYFEQENQGVSVARNIGLDNATGDWIAFLDADDYLTTHSLKSRVNLLSKHPDAAFIDGEVDTYDNSLSSLVSSWAPSFAGQPLEALVFRTEQCFRCQSWMVRNTGSLVPFKVGMTHGEDLLFFIANASNGEYVHVKETVLFYRSGHVSAMNNLEGLEKGYRTLYHEIKLQCPEFNQAQLATLRKRYVRIIKRSYLKQARPFKALQVSKHFPS